MCSHCHRPTGTRDTLRPVRGDFFVEEHHRMRNRRLSVEVTNACNFNCQHCFNRPPSRAELAQVDLHEIRRLVDEAYALGCRDVLLTGGEPLIWPHFASLYEHISSYADLSVKLNTNASLIDDHLADMFARCPPANIHVGLYGWDQASYATITGNQRAYELTTRGISLLRQRNLRYYLLIPGIRLLAENQAQIDRFAVGLGAETVVRDWILGDHVCGDTTKNAQIRSVRLTPREAALGLIREKGGVEKIMGELLSPSPRDYACLFSCLRNYRQVIIDPHLNLLPCIILRHPDYIFNLQHSTLREGLALVERVAQIPHQRTEERDRCGACQIRGICRNCPANAFLEHGDFEGIGEYYCRISKEVAGVLGLPT